MVRPGAPAGPQTAMTRHSSTGRQASGSAAWSEQPPARRLERTAQTVGVEDVEGIRASAASRAAVST